MVHPFRSYLHIVLSLAPINRTASGVEQAVGQGGRMPLQVSMQGARIGLCPPPTFNGPLPPTLFNGFTPYRPTASYYYYRCSARISYILCPRLARYSAKGASIAAIVASSRHTCETALRSSLFHSNAGALLQSAKTYQELHACNNGSTKTEPFDGELSPPWYKLNS